MELELTRMVGVGAGDLQHAARAEVGRIIKETGGDELAQTKLLIGRLRELDLVTDAEVRVVSRLAEVDDETRAGKKSARDAYFESRDAYNTLLAGGQASPVALVLASSAVGSYSVTEDADGSGTVVVAKKNTGQWEKRGAAAGAVIGSMWGPAGAAIGGAVGGIVGAAVDEC